MLMSLLSSIQSLERKPHQNRVIITRNIETQTHILNFFMILNIFVGHLGFLALKTFPDFSELELFDILLIRLHTTTVPKFSTTQFFSVLKLMLLGYIVPT